jgi:DNA-binding MurR/RpiR family transcriptional regulator
VPREHFERAVEWLSDAAGSVYVMGLLSSYGLAWVFWVMANYLRPNVHLLAHTGALPNQLINVGPDDALLAVSHRRYARQTTLAMRHVGQRGGRVILVTDSELSPPARFADLVLVAPGSSAVMFDSGCAALAVLEALAEAMSERLEASLFDRLEVMDRVFEDFGAFAPGPDYPLTGRVPRKNRIS